MNAQEAEKHLSRARVQLLLRRPFWGTLALGLKFKEAKGMGTCGTDGRYLYYDPDAVERWSVLYNETFHTPSGAMTRRASLLEGVIAHECGHLFLGHLWRRQRREEWRWNIATDCPLNELLDADGFQLPPGCLFPPKDCKGKNAEFTYDKIPECEKCKNGTHGKGGGQSADGSHHGNTLDDHGVWKNAEQKDMTGGTDADNRGPATEEEWKQKAVQAATAAKMQGKLPAHIAALIDQLVRPRVDWRSLLRDYLESIVKTDYRMMPPNKRYLWMPLYLPSLHGEHVEFAVAVDTSGSISEKLLTSFVSEVRNISEQFQSYTVHLFDCDAEVHFYKVVEDLWSWPREWKGRGGTDFRPVFNAISDKGVRPSCLVYLTDLYGSFPDHAPDYPVIWVTPTEDRDPPFGVKVLIEKE